MLHEGGEMRVEDVDHLYEDEDIRQKAADERKRQLEAERRSKTPLQRLQNALLGAVSGLMSKDEMVRQFVQNEEDHFSLV